MTIYGTPKDYIPTQRAFDPNELTSEPFDALPRATRLAIGHHVTSLIKSQIKAGVIAQNDFMTAFVAKCRLIAANPEEVNEIVAKADMPKTDRAHGNSR